MIMLEIVAIYGTFFHISPLPPAVRLLTALWAIFPHHLVYNYGVFMASLKSLSILIWPVLLVRSVHLCGLDATSCCLFFKFTGILF